MNINTKRTGRSVASLAAEVLNDPNASKLDKSLAASALSQSKTDRQTSAELEDKAAKALADANSKETTKTLAASVLAQANKER